MLANWFSCVCNLWKCLSIIFRRSSTVAILMSVWSVCF
jgi:hypothetical protein